ncbi:MAG TPA: hypothetical protein IAC62_14555 [Candidatus Pelethocola excrementipullorum]|nr:hypothetical protein [Candidatus Pelethocola excrementipullorum]
MKKGSIFIVSCLILIFTMFGCGKNEKTDYTIDEFGKIYVETQELFNEKTKYFTSEELIGDEAYKVYIECSKKTGLPINEEITLRGNKNSNSLGFSVSSLENENYKIYCLLPKGEKNISTLINDGDPIQVKGIFNKPDYPYGFLSESQIISPVKINTGYSENVDDALSQIDIDSIMTDVLVFGEVDSIMLMDEFINVYSNMTFSESFDISSIYGDKIACIHSTQDDSPGIFYVSYYEELMPGIKEGDKVAIRGYAKDMLNFLKADGSRTVVNAFINIPQSYYVFE